MKKILIVEDDKNLNKGLSISFVKYYEIISVFTKKEALLHIEGVDLILLDMNLADGQGL